MRSWQRFDPLAGVVAFVLWVVGTFLLENTDRPEGKDAAEFAAWVADNDTELIAGTVVFGFGVLFFLWFLGALRVRLGEAEGGARHLTAVAFMLCLAQAGPLLILVPAAIWLFYQDHTAWGVFLAVWSVIVGTLDNVLRPILIRLGADIPLLLIFAGVIGGLFAFGLVGIFVGPVLLAVSYTLLDSWIDDDPGI